MHRCTLAAGDLLSSFPCIWLSWYIFNMHPLKTFRYWKLVLIKETDFCNVTGILKDTYTCLLLWCSFILRLSFLMPGLFQAMSSHVMRWDNDLIVVFLFGGCDWLVFGEMMFEEEYGGGCAFHIKALLPLTWQDWAVVY